MVEDARQGSLRPPSQAVPELLLIYGDKERAGASSSSSAVAPLSVEKRISDVLDNANDKALEEILRIIAESNEGDQSHEVKRPKVIGA